MAQQPPPLPLRDKHQPPLHSYSEPPPLPFSEPPPLPTQSVPSSFELVAAKKGGLNPNITFLLGIWAGVGLCAVAFAVLAISGRFGPFVRWIETAAKGESPAPSVQSSRQPISPIADENAENAETLPVEVAPPEPAQTEEPVVAESPDAPPDEVARPESTETEKPATESEEFREGFSSGKDFSGELNDIIHAQGRKMTESEFKRALNSVRQLDNPYPEDSPKAQDWLSGWERGARTGLGKNLATD